MADANSSRRERRQVFYSGRVQGVGFRYTARQLAGQHAVAGFVRNLTDGRVELIVEGQATELDALMEEIAARLGDHIRDVSVDVRPATGEYSGFEVRH